MVTTAYDSSLADVPPNLVWRSRWLKGKRKQLDVGALVLPYAPISISLRLLNPFDLALL